MKKCIICFAAIALAVAGFFLSTSREAQSAGNEVFGSGPHFQTTQANTNGLRIAVTPPFYDDIGKVLKSMGWTYTDIQETQLTDNEFLAQFDVIFINCPFYASDSARNAKDSLEQFVREGGTLYASDNAYEYIDMSFPGYINFYEHPGDVGAQTINANVVDPGLASALNTSTLQIHFNWTAWVPVASVADTVKVYLSGDFTIRGSTPAGTTPLSVSFPYGKGRVVYTAYHNNEQVTDEEKKLLSYLVLISTTEKLSAQLQENLAGLGYGIQEENLGSLSTGDTSPRFTYTNPSITNLAVGLNWQEGTLRLSVFKPDGSLFAQQEGLTSLIIEIPNADAGDWSYQVDAIDVPHDNYPYVVQISVPAIVAATPSATPENSSGIVQITPSAIPDNSTDTGNTPGKNSSGLYLVIGGILCLALLFAVVLIGAVVFFIKRRRA